MCAKATIDKKSGNMPCNECTMRMCNVHSSCCFVMDQVVTLVN